MDYLRFENTTIRLLSPFAIWNRQEVLVFLQQ